MPQDQPPDTTYKGRKPPPWVCQQWHREALEFMAAANGHHVGVGKHQGEALLHAKQAGEALSKAKHRIRYRKWGKFLREEFEGSKETARVYMRVARGWDDPRIQEAKRGEMTPTSIEGFLAILRNKPQVPPPKPAVLQQATAMCRSIRDQFLKRLNKLEPEELDVLGQSFDGAWETMYEGLKSTCFFCMRTPRRRSVRPTGAKSRG